MTSKNSVFILNKFLRSLDQSLKPMLIHGERSAMNVGMNDLQLDLLMKALLDGATNPKTLAERSGLSLEKITELAPALERGFSLIDGFRKFASENAKPVGLPPPPNPYLDREKDMDEQRPECYAFEAIQRGRISIEKCRFTCTQLGIAEDDVQTAIDTVCIPWREANGWRSYAMLDANDCYVLMDKAPVKIKRPLEHLRRRLQA